MITVCLRGFLDANGCAARVGDWVMGEAVHVWGEERGGNFRAFCSILL